MPKIAYEALDELGAIAFRCLTSITYSFEEQFKGSAALPGKQRLADKILAFINHNSHAPESPSVENGCELLNRIIELDNHKKQGIQEYLLTPSSPE